MCAMPDGVCICGPTYCTTAWYKSNYVFLSICGVVFVGVFLSSRHSAAVRMCGIVRVCARVHV